MEKLLKGLTLLCALTLSTSALADSIADFNNSWAGKALALQRQLDVASPLKDNNILGTHNSYNSSDYTTPIRYLDPQQQHSIQDQLRMGARFIELDAHWTAHTHGWPWEWGTGLLLCHSGIGTSWGDLHVGCSTTDRFVRDGLQEVRSWLDANPNEVIILYVEDHTDGRHQELLNVLNSTLGGKIYASGGCKAIPDTLTKAQVRQAGKQVVFWKDGGCSGNSGMASLAYDSLGNIGRIWEDGTAIGFFNGLFNGGVDRISADNVRTAFKTGGNIVNLDHMVTTDGRLAAGVWSWDANEPNNYGGNQDCAVQWGNGRWDDTDCSNRFAYACHQPGTNNWYVTQQTGTWSGGAAACAAVGNNYKFDVPTNSYDNEQLKAAKGPVANVWLNHNDIAVEGQWIIPGVTTGAAAYRALTDGRSGLCLDVSNSGTANGTPVQLWTCNGTNAQKWWYDAANGFLRSAVGSNKCLDNRGQAYNGGEIVIWDCVDSNNLRFDWIGNTLRNRHNNSIAVDAYGTSAGSRVGQWSYNGGLNQQWNWGN
ncbi:MAG: hypothetical protein K0S46_654 [Moraxellaceae bacterium]|jgi:hypothetical protein|nr:hypothetical protein [Moraxellaceae bacterium]